MTNIALEEARKLQERIEALEKEETPLEREYNAINILWEEVYRKVRQLDHKCSEIRVSRRTEIETLKVGRNALLEKAKEQTEGTSALCAITTSG